MWFNYSLIIDEGLSQNDPEFWSRPTPVDCGSVRIVGIFLCIAAFIGIMLNGALVYSFIRYKVLRSSANIYVMFIAIMGLLASSTILPLTGLSSIYCQWLYKRIGCQLGAVIAFLYGCSSSYLLCVVSFSRCYIIIRPFHANRVTVSHKLINK
jgi:c-opsin